MKHLDAPQPHCMPLVDHRAVDWQRVKSTRYFFYQRFHYSYPGPIRNLRQSLVVVPADRYGDQRLCEYRLIVDPEPTAHRHSTDSFGNRVFELEVPSVAESIAFEVVSTLERTPAIRKPPMLSERQARYFLQPTHLTAADERISATARELSAAGPGGMELAERISAWVSDTMRYGADATSVKTTAAEALAIGTGLCQDYSHVMIALCHEAGLPARYVSGHLLGEGSSHAWVEVLLPHSGSRRFEAVAFDPTNRRRPNLSYITVATGRDYRDVPPTSGSFTGPSGGRLTFSKRAGLTRVVYLDGEVVSSG